MNCEGCTFLSSNSKYLNDFIPREGRVCGFYNRLTKLNTKKLSWCNAKTSKDVTKEEVREKISLKVLIVVRDGSLEDQLITAESIRYQTKEPTHTCFVSEDGDIIEMRHIIQGLDYTIPRSLFEDFEDNTAFNLARKYESDYLLVLNAGSEIKNTFIEDLDRLFNDELDIIYGNFRFDWDNQNEEYLVSTYFYKELFGNLEKPILEKLKDINAPLRYDFDLQP